MKRANTKARASLPKGLDIKQSNITGAGEGVFALENIKPGVRYGPYQGKKVYKSLAHDGRDTGYMWEVWDLVLFPISIISLVTCFGASSLFLKIMTPQYQMKSAWKKEMLLATPSFVLCVFYTGKGPMT